MIESYEMTETGFSRTPSRLSHEFRAVVQAYDLASEALCQKNGAGAGAGCDVQHALPRAKIEQISQPLGELETSRVKRVSQEQARIIAFV